MLNVHISLKSPRKLSTKSNALDATKRSLVFDLNAVSARTSITAKIVKKAKYMNTSF